MKREHIFIAFCLGFLGGCGQGSQPSLSPAITTPALIAESETPRELLGINSILIAAPIFDPRARSASGGQNRILAQLEQAAREQMDVQLIDAESARVAASKATSDDSARAVARQFGGDAVLRTTILRYTERQGSAVGATQPAGVDFSMRLLRSSDGKTVWTASYHFQDEFLSQNLFKARQRFSSEAGVGWRSAQDLLADGFRSALSQLSSRRIEQFSGGKPQG